MIKLCALTAVRFSVVIFSAVFFSTSGLAGESPLNSFENDLTELVKRLSRSVVTVEVSEFLPSGRFGNATDETYSIQLTTGIIIDSSGYILVAARPVLRGGRIVIRLGETPVMAELVAVDYQTELAILRPAAQCGSPGGVCRQHVGAGQMVIAINNAHGLRSSPSLGFCAGIRDDGLIQFSIPGIIDHEGVGVYDLSGNLLGFVVNSEAGIPGKVLAVPAYQIPAIIDYLLENGDRHSGFVGITSQEIEIFPGIPIPYSPVRQVSSCNSWDTVERGVVVTSIVPASPAQWAGLAIGDIIYSVDDMPINSAPGLAALVRQTLPGTELQLGAVRQNRFLRVPLVVGQKKLIPSTRATNEPGIFDQEQLADSLRQALKLLQGQLDNLENRLGDLD